MEITCNDLIDVVEVYEERVQDTRDILGVQTVAASTRAAALFATLEDLGFVLTKAS